MQPVPARAELPFSALAWSRVQEARVPGERNADLATISKSHCEALVVDLYIDDAFTGPVV
jgi:hypothetical protein